MDTNSQHTVTIREERLTAMKHKLSDRPKLLSVAATCSIFKVPRTLRRVNGVSLQPQLVSVGPFHHGKPQLEMIQEHKWRFLRQLLERTASKGMGLEDYLKAVQPLEAKARECYSEAIPFDPDDFIEMMVLDGCFIIELFRVHDPLLMKAWIRSYFVRDLIRLDNQIPFFVLERLFELTNTRGSSTLVKLALHFFNYGFQIPDEINPDEIQPKHLLDLLRSTFLTPDINRHLAQIPDEIGPHEINPDEIKSKHLLDLLRNLARGRISLQPHMIHSISKLRRSGIRLKPREHESFLAVKFKNGVIQMPRIAIDDFMCALLQNAVAFEQCHSGCTGHFTTYVILLDCLINTSEDVGLLCDSRIIDNYLGSDGEVATFINNVGKGIPYYTRDFYLEEVFENVDRQYRSKWRVQLATFKDTYFKTPWLIISAVAASILLGLTIAQTVIAALGL